MWSLEIKGFENMKEYLLLGDDKLGMSAYKNSISKTAEEAYLNYVNFTTYKKNLLKTLEEEEQKFNVQDNEFRKKIDALREIYIKNVHSLREKLLPENVKNSCIKYDDINFKFVCNENSDEQDK